MTEERRKAIEDWCVEYCPKCGYNADKGTGYVDCQAEHEVVKGFGIQCIHYDHPSNQEKDEREWVEPKDGRMDYGMSYYMIRVDQTNTGKWEAHGYYTDLELVRMKAKVEKKYSRPNEKVSIYKVTELHTAVKVEEVWEDKDGKAIRDNHT